MASVFDTERIQWLEEVKVKRYKIASRSIHDRDLINALVKTNKPLIASLGYWKDECLPNIKSNAIVKFLYCISEYPTEISKINFNTIDFEKKYDGFSDHTNDIHTSMVAFARKAKIVERHLTLDKKMYGPDHACSMNIEELSKLNNFRSSLLKCTQ